MASAALLTTQTSGSLRNTLHSSDQESEHEIDPDERENLDHFDDLESEEKDAEAQVPYTIFHGWRRALLMVCLSSIGIWSSIANSIYFPALPTLTRYFGVSSEVMNLSLVAYLIFQGITPTFTSNLADSVGRRPVIIISFSIYIAACIGISQTRVYWLLAVLRCVQAGGIAPVIAIISGISGDVCTPANRGGFVGIVSGMTLVGQAFGSVLGSLLISRWDWRAVFVFLAIGAGATLCVMLFCLPETCRSIVGNGLVKPSVIYCAPILSLPGYKELMTNDIQTITPRPEIDFLLPFKVLMEPAVISVLVPAGLQFASWTMLLTSLSTELEGPHYNYTVVHVGLMYLPQGICCLTGSFVAGKVLNKYYQYRHAAYEKKWLVAERKAHPFNSLRVRLDPTIVPFLLTFFGLILFGWVLDKHLHVIGVVIASCIVSFGSASYISMVTTMVVDLHPARGLASASCINLVRCLLSAGAVAALDKMQSSMGIGGCYTLMAGFCLLANVCLVLVVVTRLKKLVT